MVERKKSSRELTRLARTAWEGLLPAWRILIQPKTLAQLPRLLTEGAGPIRRMFMQAHNGREVARLLDQGEQITFVNSFPRSGNWWVRYLLSDVFHQNQGIETTTGHAVRAERVVPDFYCEMIARRDLSIRTPGVLIKSHDDFPVLRQRFCRAGPGTDDQKRKLAAFNACRHLCPYRSPEDSLVSMFHFYLRVNYVKSKAGNDINAFCLEHLPGWISHVSSHLAAAEEGTSVFFVSYHQLLQQPAAGLSEMLAWLGVPHTAENLERAVSNTRFNKLQAIEPSLTGRNTPFFRRGRDGSGMLDLKPETLLAIRENTAHWMAQANDRVARQRAQCRVIPASPAFESLST